MRRQGHFRLPVMAAVAAGLVLAGAAAPAGEQDRVRWLGEMRHVALFAPLTATGEAPLLLVLGEPGRSARYALDSWREVAERKGFIVASVSSRASRLWRAPQDGPGLLRAVVNRVASRRAVDRRRVYLFGAGSGGGFAVSMATLQPRYFAAAATFNGDVAPGAVRPADRFERALPVYIYVSKRLPQFEIDALQETAAALRQAGAEVAVESLSMGPDFERKGGKAAGRIWEALSAHALSEAPRYSPTRFDR